MLRCALSEPEENETGNWGRSKGILRSGAEANRLGWQGSAYWGTTEFLSPSPARLLRGARTPGS